MTWPLNVYSEIGELKTVLVHRPGKEVENITPSTLERLLFDDIPYLPLIQNEHDYFVSAMKNRGVEVVYLENLATEALVNAEIREEFIEDLLCESKQTGEFYPILKEYLTTLTSKKLVEEAMIGVKREQLGLVNEKVSLSDLVSDNDPFLLDPMPNLYFTRDPAAVIGAGISINRMSRRARRRESLFMSYIIKHHSRFANHNVPLWYDRKEEYSLEGGDQLVLSDEVIAIGISDRSTAQAIDSLANSIFAKQDKINKILAISIPKKRAFMHLDTVFTMVDCDKFTIHSEIQDKDGSIDIYVLERGKDQGEIKITPRRDLFAVLREVLNLSEVLLIPCGGGDPIAAAREQWNDGSNTLAIAPGVVVTYDRNYVSNDVLRRNGIEVVEVLSSELARGRGGPRCMSMPLYRSNLKK